MIPRIERVSVPGDDSTEIEDPIYSLGLTYIRVKNRVDVRR